MFPTTTPDEVEEQGRVLSSYEYVALLNRRPDIFDVEKEKRLKVLMPIMLLLGILISGYITWILDITKMNIDFAETYLRKQKVTLSSIEVSLEPEKPIEKPPIKKPFKQEQADLKVANNSHSHEKSNGSGTATATVTHKGLVGVLTGHISGTEIANADIFCKGGYSSGVDILLAGVGGLKQGTSGGSGRKGVASIGFGDGINTGFGGGSGGVDALDGLMPGSSAKVRLVRKKPHTYAAPSGATASQLVGGRSKANIMRVVRQNLAALRYAFNKRLREKPGLKGKVTVHWAIDEFGNVLFAKVTGTTIEDEVFAQEVLKKVKLWKFGKISKPGDVTEVTYPFVFTQ